MPPCRSRPRLIAFFGGYRYQHDNSSTTATRPIRTQSDLRILVAACRLLHDAPDGAAVEFELHAAVGHPEHDGLVGEIENRAVHAARRHDPITFFHCGEHRLALAPLALLRPDEQEVEDREDRSEERELREDRARAAAG